MTWSRASGRSSGAAAPSAGSPTPRFSSIRRQLAEGDAGMTPSLQNGVIDLLRATGNALRGLGAQLDVNAGLAVADRILQDAVGNLQGG